MSANDQDEGRGRVRASDADRERVVDQLRRHHEAGRLDGDEFTERMEHALSARWIDELPPLLSDLPDPDQPDAAEAPAGPAGSRGPGLGTRTCRCSVRLSGCWSSWRSSDPSLPW